MSLEPKQPSFHLLQSPETRKNASAQSENREALRSVLVLEDGSNIQRSIRSEINVNCIDTHQFPAFGNECAIPVTFGEFNSSVKAPNPRKEEGGIFATSSPCSKQ